MSFGLDLPIGYFPCTPVSSKNGREEVAKIDKLPEAVSTGSLSSIIPGLLKLSLSASHTGTWNI